MIGLKYYGIHNGTGTGIDPETLLFTMDPKYPPGSDLIAKMVLRNPNVINMIITAVVGAEACSLYSPRPTEWSNGTKSDVIYAATITSKKLPPVLIEVQHTITIDFIARLLGYSLCIKKGFKAKPIVVVFGTHATRNDISLDFEATSFPFAKQIPSKYWTEKCYILDQSTIAEAAETAPLSLI
ncbi:hypothetical protein CLU79DRAFT_841233 [Phycomyces nitens]|nr:hypothetical protein CLU79DRAFT_841233 [Phycomyces nitens]